MAVGELGESHAFWISLRLGKLFGHDAYSDQYLAESICKHPDLQTLKTMMESAELAHVQIRNLTGGIVAIHRGYKL